VNRKIDDIQEGMQFDIWHKKLFSQEFVGRFEVGKSDISGLLGDHWHTVYYRGMPAGQIEITFILDGQSEAPMEKKVATNLNVGLFFSWISSLSLTLLLRRFLLLSHSPRRH